MSKGARRIILASGSPRRVDLLEKLGLAFVTVASTLEEVVEPGLRPEDVATSLASQKALEVSSRLKTDDEPEGILILGADTVVVVDDQILGKPVNVGDARRMLKLLSGRCHQVITGVSLVLMPESAVEEGFESSKVFFRDVDQAEIDSYIVTGEPMDKAGAYALQGIGSAFVDRIEGCYTNVIGLPVPLVVGMLRSRGVSVLGLPDRSGPCLGD